MRHSALNARGILPPVRTYRTRRHRLLARREPILRGYRQGQQHHQLPPAHGPNRSVWHGAIFNYRPAQRHGRTRSGRDGQHAGRAHGSGAAGPPENSAGFLEQPLLSAASNHGTRAFDIGGLGELTSDEYDALLPTQWPANRPFDNGRFFHPDARARFVVTLPTPPVHALDEEYPLVLNTGRIRDQWHTMTRSGKAPRLTAHLPEPYIDMHEQDALLSGVRAGQLARVSTRWGSLVARLRISGELPRRMIFVPIHWSAAFSSDARVGALVNPVVDPVSGEPEFKHTPAQVAPFVVAWQGFILSRQALDVTDMTWWSHNQGEQFLRYELAGRRVAGDWSPWARRLLNAGSCDADWLEYIDIGSGIYRAAHLIDDRLDACVFISPRPDMPARAWLSGLFVKQALDDSERAGLLRGHSTQGSADIGAVICSCFGVGRNSICSAIRQHRLTSPQQIGQRLRAGTNCGSCLPELKALLNEERIALNDL